jgi:carboxyl-terminal processing protease
MKKLLLLAISVCTHIVAFAQPEASISAKELEKKLEEGAFEISLYNTACYFALAGNKKLALNYLNKAIDDGFNNSKTMLEDSDLKSLHNEKDWTLLLQRIQERETTKTKENELFFNRPEFWDSKFFKTAYRDDLSEVEKVAGLSRFWSESKYNFVNFDLVPNVNIDSLYFEYLPKVKNTKSTLEYYKMLMEMCARLKDGHTNIIAPKELVEDVYARPLIRTRLIEDKVLILQSDPEMQNKGLKVGMEVLTINNMPVKEYAAKLITPYESASTPQDLAVRSFDYALLAGSVKQPIHLTLRDFKGSITDQTISRVSPSERSKKLGSAPVEYKILPGNVSYLAINSFATDTGSKVFKEKYPEISQSKALIIDLRNNGGGSSDWQILRYLIREPQLIHKMYTRQYNASFRAWGQLQGTWGNTNGIGPVKDQLFSKPVILLISARTFSAAEDFAAAFKSLKRGLIIGEPSGGSTGQPLGFQLPGGLSARVCTKRDQYPDGSDFVGKGIAPDIVVLPTVSDIRKGIDTQLGAALKELRKP